MLNPPSGGAPAGTLAYGEAMIFDVAFPNPIHAWQMVQQWSQRPFVAIGGNCLNFTYDVLTAFGVDGLPAPSQDIEPFVWFGALQGRRVPV